MNARDTLLHRQPASSGPPAGRRCRRPVARSTTWISLLLASLVWTAAATAQTYDLVFDPPGPIMVSENVGTIDVEVSVSTDCGSGWSVTWEPEINHLTTNGLDVGLPSPDPVGLSDIGGGTLVVDIPINDDALTEGNETFHFVLTPSADVAMECDTPEWTPNQSEYKILIEIVDDDTSPQLEILDASFFEGDGPRNEQVRVQLSFADGVNNPITVDYVGVSGTATQGEDWGMSPNTLTFDPGVTEQLIPIRIFGDDVREDDEQFVIRLQNPDGADLLKSEATVTLRNDDEFEAPVVTFEDASVTEGDDGITELTLEVSLDAPAPEPLHFAYRTENGTARAGLDYQGADDSILFEVGDLTAEITLSILGDTEAEGDEMFRVKLQQVSIDNSTSPGASFDKAGSEGRRQGDARTTMPRATAQATAQMGAQTTVQRITAVGDFESVVTIVDDDSEEPPPMPELSVADVAVTEGDEGTTTARFPVRLSEPVTYDVTAHYETADGTATAADTDYQPTAGIVTVPAGSTQAFVDVSVVGDTRVEDDEFFFLRLTSADGADVSRDEARGAIRNDDEEEDGGGGQDSIVRLRQPTPATEGAGPAVIAVERTGSDAGAVRALLRFGGGTATRGSDYEGAQRVVQWAAGQLGVIEVAVALVDDTVREDNEFFGVQIAEAQGAEIGTPAEIRQPIVDDDTPMTLVAVSDLEQNVQVGTQTVVEARVVRDDGEPVGGATVRWLAQGRTALRGEEATVSDADGIVRQPLQFADTPGPARLFAGLLGTDSSLEFRFRVAGTLDSTVGDDDGDDGDITDAFDEGCADEDAGDAFREACDYLYGLETPAERAAALLGLSPRQALPHQRQALRAPRNQVRNVSARLTALRGGMARSAFDQLAVSIQGQGLSLGPLQQAIASSNPRVAEMDLSERVDLALRRAAGLAAFDGGGRYLASPARGGGGAGSDSNSGGDDFDYGGESPWGMFFNGRVSFGDAPRLGARPDFEFQTEGLTVGVDRRMGTKWVLGAALGYTQSDTEVGADLGTLDLEGLSLSVYTTYYTERWYVDGVVTYGENDYDVERVITLPRAFRGVTRLVAVGAPDATQTAANLAFGFDSRLGEALTLSTFVRANWTRAEIDGYTESGALLFNLRFDQQTLDSLLGEVGVELTRPISFDWGVLQPLLRVAVLHEFDDDIDIVRARFALGRSPRTFRLVAEPTDRDFFNVAIGATATLNRGWATYFQYDTDLERDDLDLYTLSGGFRFQF